MGQQVVVAVENRTRMARMGEWQQQCGTECGRVAAEQVIGQAAEGTVASVGVATMFRTATGHKRSRRSPMRAGRTRYTMKMYVCSPEGIAAADEYRSSMKGGGDRIRDTTHV